MACSVVHGLVKLLTPIGYTVDDPCKSWEYAPDTPMGVQIAILFPIAVLLAGAHTFRALTSLF